MPRKKLIINDLSEATLQKMMRLRENDGFSDRTWGAWLNYKFKSELINENPSQVVTNSTRDLMLEMWIQNFAQNLADIREGCSISDLVPEGAEEIDVGKKSPLGPAVVVGAGPSIWSHKHLDVLADAINSGKYQGIICSTDRMLIPFLERGIVPYISLGVDGSPIIKKFYDHPLVERYASQIQAVLNTTTNRNVIEHCKRIGIKILWFNPLFDDPRRSNESFTKLQRIMTTTEKHPNGVCAMSAGGNAGTATWVVAHTLLRRGNIALIGMDMGYPEGTKLENTPYFSALQYAADPTGAIGKFYAKIYHPTFKSYAYTDSIFSHYRQSFKQMALKAPPWAETVNCTEGGTLWGERIKCMKFSTWLESLKS